MIDSYKISIVIMIDTQEFFEDFKINTVQKLTNSFNLKLGFIEILGLIESLGLTESKFEINLWSV